MTDAVVFMLVLDMFFFCLSIWMKSRERERHREMAMIARRGHVNDRCGFLVGFGHGFFCLSIWMKSRERERERERESLTYRDGHDRLGSCQCGGFLVGFGHGFLPVHLDEKQTDRQRQRERERERERDPESLTEGMAMLCQSGGGRGNWSLSSHTTTLWIHTNNSKVPSSPSLFPLFFLLHFPLFYFSITIMFLLFMFKHLLSKQSSLRADLCALSKNN